MVSDPNSEQERLLDEIVNAPLKEAIFDVRVELPPSTSLQTLEALPGKIAGEYPNHKRLWKQSFTLKAGSADSAVTPPEAQGFICHSQDQQQVVQFRLDGFTFSRLPPYTRWKHLFPQVKDLWSLYAEVAAPSRVTRVANRYINVIEFPRERVSLDEYLTVAPRVPEGLPQELKEFLYRVVFQFPNDDITAIVTQANHPSPRAAVVAVLLDIDVFRLVNYEPSASMLWETFERLHEVRNDIFLKYLQDPTLKLFK